MKLAVVLVHYRSPELLQPACEALLRDAEDGGIELEGVVVDNGSRPADAARLRELPFARLDPGSNLGYAGGVNLGIWSTSADFVLAMNPDVLVLPGCLAALAAALDDGASAAGPRFYGDHSKRFLLPPTEPVSRRSELLRVLAERGEPWAGRARQAWRRHARRHWLAVELLASWDLSGALLAIRRDAWRRVGPFDEGYRLYFEETDWLRRLRATGLEARFVPAAEAVHLYAQSTPHEGQAAEWFLESNRRFRRRAYGKTFTALLEWFGSRRRKTSEPSPRPSPEGRGRPLPPDSGMWLEVSPSPLGFPAAGRRLDPGMPARYALRSWLPEEIKERLASGTYFLRTVDADGRETELEIVEWPPDRPERRSD